MKSNFEECKQNRMESYKRFVAKKKKINKNASKVVAAIVELGFYEFSFDRQSDEYIAIDITGFNESPYTKILVYYDGYVHYLNGNGTFEGTTKRSSIIKLDILNKEK
jgi:hypothetical protein